MLLHIHAKSHQHFLKFIIRLAPDRFARHITHSRQLFKLAGCCLMRHKTALGNLFHHDSPAPIAQKFNYLSLLRRKPSHPRLIVRCQLIQRLQKRFHKSIERVASQKFRKNHINAVVAASQLMDCFNSRTSGWCFYE